MPKKQVVYRQATDVRTVHFIVCSDKRLVMLFIVCFSFFQIMKCNENEDNLEKCTICLCEFEDDEDVR